MTKKEYLENIINMRVNIMHKLHVSDNELFLESGIETNFDEEKDLQELKLLYTEEAKKASKRVDWSLLNVDKEKFDKLFFSELLKA